MMDAQHIQIKVFAAEAGRVKLTDFIPVFHKWIREKVSDELLIDVADYAHVPGGPGVLLIGHEGNYSYDVGPSNRPGLLYRRKTKAGGTNAEKIADALQRAFKACERLEGAGVAGLSFSTKQIELVINDRLMGPNEETAAAELKKDFESAWKRFDPGSVTIERTSKDPRDRLALLLTRSTDSPVGDLLKSAV